MFFFCLIFCSRDLDPPAQGDKIDISAKKLYVFLPKFSPILIGFYQPCLSLRFFLDFFLGFLSLSKGCLLFMMIFFQFQCSSNMEC